MTSSLLRQPDFSGGEIGPLAYGQTDSRAYKYGLRLARNFLPTLDGPLVNRPGTRFVSEVQDSTYAPSLIGFSFSDGQTFILEIGDKYLRVFHSGALVGGVVVTGAVPWAIADVPSLRWAQNGDVITFTHPSYQPYEVARISNTNWTVTAVSYSPQAYFAGKPYIAFTNRNPTAGNQLVSIGAALSAFPDYSASTTYATGDWVRELNGGVTYRVYVSLVDGNINNDPAANPTLWGQATWSGTPAFKKGDYTWQATSLVDGQTYILLLDQQTGGGTPSSSSTNWVTATDTARTARVWQWVVTQVWQDANGVIGETLGSAPTTSIQVAIGTDRPAAIAWAAEAGGPVGYVLLSYRVYRGRNGVFGFVGSAAAGTRTFNDDGSAPDYGTQPPRGTNPFDIATGSNTKTQSWPTAFTYHEQRAVYAGSPKKPQDFWGSKIGSYKNFDINTPVQDSDSFDFRPASDRLEDVRHLLSLRHLLLFTGSGVWNCYGGNGPITPTNVILRRANRLGADDLRPLAVDLSALYLTDRGRVRDLAWDWRTDNYIGRDVSLIARHLIERRTIVDWAFAETPYSVIWAVRDDGVMLSFTYELGRVEAWAQHTTVGAFERVCTVLEADPNTGVLEDAVYVVIRRVINGAVKRYIERMSSRLMPQKSVANIDATTTFTSDVRLCNFLDASLQYDGRNAAATTIGASLPSWNNIGSFPLNYVVIYGASNTVYRSLQGGNVGNQPDISPTWWQSMGPQFTVGTWANVLASAPAFAPTDAGSASVVFDPDGISGGPVTARIVSFVDTAHVVVEFDAELPYAMTFSSAAWGIGRSVLSGFSHLEGQSVNALLDGAAAGPFVVTGGQVALGSPAVLAQVGIGYNSDMELLDMGIEQVKTNQKSVRKVTFEVVETRGMLAGQSFDDLTLYKAAKLYAPQLQSVADGFAVPPLVTGNAEVVIASTWNNHGGRACLRQSDPLPCSVVAAVREVVVGGR